MDEETVKGNGEVAPVESAPAAAPEAATPAASTPAKDPVQEAIDRIRREYEGPGGHIAKLKSERDKAKAEAERLAALERQRAVETLRQTNAIAQQDPERAYQVLSSQHEALLRQGQQAESQQAWQEWVAGVATELELLTGDAEADSKVWEEIDAVGKKVWSEYPADQAPFEFQKQLAVRAKDRQKEARKMAEKKAAEVEAGLPGLVAKEVKRALADAGYSEPDTSVPGRPAKKDPEDVPGESPEERMKARLIAERKARATQQQ